MGTGRPGNGINRGISKLDGQERKKTQLPPNYTSESHPKKLQQSTKSQLQWNIQTKPNTKRTQG